MHFFKVSLKEELLCVRITITLRNVCVSDLEWGMLPEGAESMRFLQEVPSRGMDPRVLSLFSGAAQLQVGPAVVDPLGPHECSVLISRDGSGDPGW